MRAALALALALSALTLSACGGASLDAVAKAATKATSAGSEHIVLTGTVTTAGQTVSMSGTGDFQSSPNLGAMHLSLHAAGKDYVMDEVLKDTTIYMRSPLFSAGLPAGKRWVSVDLAGAAKKLGLNLTQYTQQDPTEILAALEKAGSVTKIGGDHVGGVETTHYRATIDPRKVASSANPARLKTVPVDVWIGNDGLLRRLTMDYASTAMTMDLSNYGEPVNVQVPAASETVDMTKLGGTP